MSDSEDGLVKCDGACDDWCPSDELVTLQLSTGVLRVCQNCYPEMARLYGSPSVAKGAKPWPSRSVASVPTKP